jgi:asparagine synthase (glutamine-hydrolysing)
MCGIVGMLGGDLDTPHAAYALKAACEAIHHRGPDDGGHYFDPEARIGFGHRRLSIQDLSPAGHQPMQSPDSRFVMVFNGEIYNHLDLRAELERVHGPVAWRGHSDTETLLAGAVVWGLEATLQRACGMFAIALWDRREQVLTLARDRLGEKPLYVGRAAGTILFASELAALRRWPGVERGGFHAARLDPGAAVDLAGLCQTGPGAPAGTEAR